MAAEEDFARHHLPHCGDGILQAGAIAGGVGGAGRAVGSGLAVRQVAAQNGESVRSESLCERDQQRGLSVGTGAMRQD